MTYYYAVFSLIIALIAWRLTYRLFLHPLSQFPGPVWAAVSNLPYLKWTVTGNLHTKLRELHDKYGDEVRIRPNSVAYRGPQAWNDIYGHRKGTTLPFGKDPEFFLPSPSGTSHIVNASEADHVRQKRLLTHAFSDRSLRDQEDLIMSYIDTFIDKLAGFAASNQKFNIEEWLNFLTFDIIGDLAFGEPFDCLKNSQCHPWVANVFRSIKTGAILRALSVYPVLAIMIRRCLPKSLIKRRAMHYQMGADKVRKRLQKQTSRPDFISYILRHNDQPDRRMTNQEIEANATILIQAGSETSATVMGASIFYLLTHPESYRRVTEEIRNAFTEDSGINFLNVAGLKYLNAVIEESLRLFPPLPAIEPRVVPAGGAMINGRLVAEGASVSVAKFSAFRSPSDWEEPDSFLPERWLSEESRFDRDRREVLQPFSFGPRACIGRNLAYAEMRTILTKLLWRFDLTLDSSCTQWDNAKCYIIWRKDPLWVYLHERQKP